MLLNELFAKKKPKKKNVERERRRGDSPGAPLVIPAGMLRPSGRGEVRSSAGASAMGVSFLDASEYHARPRALEELEFRDDEMSREVRRRVGWNVMMGDERKLEWVNEGEWWW